MMGMNNRIALEAAKEIDDIFAQGHASVAQRTSKVQLVILKIIRDMLDESPS